ncbi:BEN domain-containing protein 5 [Holothuria leucospilota]|uniref:BEN domain-containing protein 5 n=1 Tax=Holothuria leucospilota TaxID=206669 RepID=A0A9Q1BG55_HOLLE|nr:BEN domain-containing protein 5 [Holothuria leucospilota]
MLATKVQLNELLATSRVRFPKVYDTSVEETTEDEGEEEEKEENGCDIETEVASLIKEKKAKKQVMEKATSSSLKAILENKLKEKKSGPLFHKSPGQTKRKFCDAINTEGESTQLQKRVGYLRQELKSSQDEAEKLKKKLGETRAELVQFKELNKRLQDALLTKIENPGNQKTKERPPSSPQAQITPPHTHSPRHDHHQGEKPLEDVLQEENGKLHIGAKVWLPKDKWTAIVDQPKHSMFVKTLMVAIWGTNVLKGKSLEGKTCPRFKGDRAAKPPLTPTKVSAMKDRFMDRLNGYQLESSAKKEEFAKFNKYVCEKLQDIHRAALKTENSQPSK